MKTKTTSIHDKELTFEMCEAVEKHDFEYVKNNQRGMTGFVMLLLRGKFYMYLKCKHLLKTDVEKNFFKDHIICDYKLLCFGLYGIDMINMDFFFSVSDNDYDNERATYKGESCSMRQYISTKFGKECEAIIDACLEEISVENLEIFKSKLENGKH